jgi:hypothetical protein
MTTVALVLATAGLGLTIIVSLVLMVIGPSSESWLEQRSLLGRKPLQVALLATLIVTAIAFALLSGETGNHWLLCLAGLAALMAIAVYNGPGARMAVWSGAAAVIGLLIVLSLRNGA